MRSALNLLSSRVSFEQARRSLTSFPDPLPQRIRPSRVGWWRDVCRVRGSALGRIWQSIVGFTIWASLVAVLDLVFERKIALTHNVTPLLSVVVGLLLVFRNGSAYSRWDDGRKQWANMVCSRLPFELGNVDILLAHSRAENDSNLHTEQMSISRSLTRTIWVHAGAGSPTHGLNRAHRLPAENGPNLSVKAQYDEVSAARLVVAFLVATKHHIRREYGVNWPGEWERVQSISAPVPLFADRLPQKTLTISW